MDKKITFIGRRWKMKRSWSCFIFFVGFLSFGSKCFAETHFFASPDGSQEVPPVLTAGTGTASVNITCEGTEAEYVITVNGLTGPITAAYFQNAGAGANGPVARTFTSDFVGNTASGVWSVLDSEPLTPALVHELIAGNIYLNIHTTQNPDGEVRGQLILDDGIGFQASLNGSQEVPPVPTSATGTGTGVLIAGGIIFFITVDSLSGPLSSAYIHNAPFGANGPVVRTITMEFMGGNTAFGFWSPFDSEPLTDTLIGEFLNGELYFNILTAMNPGGEIRGQLFVMAEPYFVANLDGTQEVTPPVPDTGTGTAVAFPTRDGLVFYITVEGLSGPITSAHIHNEVVGMDGPVVRTITSDFVGNTASGVWRDSDPEPLTPALIMEALPGNLYYDIHTSANPSGEVRGQVFSVSGVNFAAQLDGAQEVPPISTNAKGTGRATLTGAGLEFDITVEGLSGSLDSAHFHNAGAGVNGPVVRTLTADFVGNTASGVWSPFDSEPLNDVLIGELLAGNIYFNIHTSSNPGGEIRGQLICTSPGSTGIEEEEQSPKVPLALILHQNSPNPFLHKTKIHFDLLRSGFVNLKVYDLIGREITTLMEEERSAGTHEVSFDGRGLSSGVYFYRMKVGDFRETRKMVLFH